MSGKKVKSVVESIRDAQKQMTDAADTLAQRVDGAKNKSLEHIHRMNRECDEWDQANSEFEDMWNQSSNNPPLDGGQDA